MHTCGGHRYSVLYTVCVVIVHMDRVGYMGHSGHVIPYDAMSASSARVHMAGRLVYKDGTTRNII